MNDERDSLLGRAVAADEASSEAWTARLYEASGGDPSRCEACGQPLDDKAPWQRGLDGAGIHLACLETVDVDDDDHAGVR